MEETQTQEMTQETTHQEPSVRKQNFYAVLEVESTNSDAKEVMIVEGATRTELKKKLSERAPGFTVIEVIRGRKVKVSTSVALNFC